MKAVKDLKVKIFADGADKVDMLEMASKSFIRGLTTNPTLMRKAGITSYKSFALDILSEVKNKPISFEVFSDDFDEMERQALEIAGWGENVYVKIPVMNTRQQPAYDLVAKLSNQKVKLNVTALMTNIQVKNVAEKLNPSIPSYISVFAGRVADTGRDPVPQMMQAVELLRGFPTIELIWASPRELLNIFQADDIGCHIITVTNDILKKLELVGKNLDEYSLETVEMFHRDALAAGYSI
jgi:transaldolase